MSTQLVRRVVMTASYLGLFLNIVTLVIFASLQLGVPDTRLAIAATFTMIATLALQAAFVIVQMLPNGRAMISVPMLGYDGWFFVIAATALPGALWHDLAALASPPLQLIMPGFATPLLNCLLLLIGRGIQQERMKSKPV